MNKNIENKDLRIKFKLVEFEKGLAMQILEQNEAFKWDGNDEYFKHKYTGDKCVFYVKSGGYLELERVGIWLRGNNTEEDYSIETIMFRNNKERDEYKIIILNSLEDWANNWKNWGDNPKTYYIDFNEHNVAYYDVPDVLKLEAYQINSNYFCISQKYLNEDKMQKVLDNAGLRHAEVCLDTTRVFNFNERFINFGKKDYSYFKGSKACLLNILKGVDKVFIKNESRKMKNEGDIYYV